jgi:hypothetical protein
VLWLNPFALFALAAVAAPILIHILIQRRAERLPFPTLRFLQPTRLASIRRHLLEDLLLLAIRMAVLAAAVAALAGPLMVTAARRQAWDRRIVRAVVTGDRSPGRAARRSEGTAPFLERTFESGSVTDGIRRAILWLDATPTARREIVVSSPLPIGSLNAGDISGIPARIGVRFDRIGTLPGTRSVDAGRLLTPGAVRARQVTLSGDATSVRDTAVSDPMAWPVDVVSSKEDRPPVDAAIAAVLSQRVWAGPPDRRATLAVVGAAQPSPEAAQVLRRAVDSASPIQQPWMADAASRVARDPDVRAAAARVATGSPDARFAAAPWQTLVSAADGRPLAAVAASSNRLLVASAAPATDMTTPLLLRSIANAMATRPDLQAAEVVPISDAQLRLWSRPAAPIASPRIENLDQDDRRWLWFAVLCLLGLEMGIRRRRRGNETDERREEIARVA